MEATIHGRGSEHDDFSQPGTAPEDPEERLQDQEGGRARWWERSLALGVCVVIVAADWLESALKPVHRRCTEFCPRCGQIGTRGITGRMNCRQCQTAWRVVKV